METMTTPLPFQAQQPIFGKVGGISELVHMNQEEREKYNISLDTYRTNLAVMKNERAEGIAEGLLIAAKKLLKSGMSKESVSSVLGLTAQQTSQL